MATDDLKKKFAERIQQRQEQMFQNSTQKTEGAQSSTTSTKPTTSTKSSSTTGSTSSTSDDLKNKFAERITNRRIELGMDQKDDDSFLSQFLADSNAGSTRGYTAARVSSPVSGYKSGLGKKGWRSYTADTELKRAAAEAEDEEKSWFEKIIGYLGTSPDSTLPMANATIAGDAYRKDTSYREPSADWNDHERDIFGYLYENDREASWRYAEELNNAIANQKKQGQVKKIQEDAISKPVRATAGALLTSPLGLADYMDALVESTARGTITEKGNVTPFEYSQAVTGGISQHLNDQYGTLNESIPVIGGKGWGDVYGLGTSIAQSSLAALTGGGGQALVSFFGSAAASGVDEAKQRGASDEQAIAYGTLAGAAESIAEMIGVDNLMKIGSAATMRQLMMNLVKQGAAEGIEEGITTLLNNFSDQLVMHDKSSFNILVQQYMKQGLSESDAKKQAWKDMANDLAFDMVSGFVSGAVHAGPQTAYQTYLTGSEMRNTYGDSQRELVDEALEINPDNAYAQKMQERLDYGKDLRGGQLLNLVNQNDAAIAADIQAQAEQRLTELGETGNVKAVAAALTKQAMGQDLTNAEKNRVSKSKFGQQVAEELNAGETQQMNETATAEDTTEPSAIHAEEYERMLESAEEAQEGAEVSDEQVTVQAPKAVETAQTVAAEPEMATVAEKETVEAQAETAAASYQQVSKPEETAEESTEAPKSVTLEDASKKYGVQAQAMVHTYQKGQDVAKYDQAYQAAYNMGKSGVSLSYAKTSEATLYLTDAQRGLAYEAGRAASNAAASEQEAKNKDAVNGNTGRRKGTVKGEGVTISDLKKTFNDAQGRAYKYLSTVAEVTGIDIVLYKSEAGDTGAYKGSQGKFRWSNNTIYIDVNAGLAYAKDAGEVSKYAMLRTFSHEFTHFIEKWNPVRYNEFRKVVFETLTERGEDVHDLIEQKQAQDATGKMTYDDASREVVAESMTDILTDANFVQELAEKHKTIFDKLLEKLTEFASNIREAFAAMGANPSREANALKEQVGDTVKYLDSIVELFNRVAVEAVENYQQTVAEDAVVEENATTETAVAEETPVETKEPVTETDPYGFTVTDNVERGSLEITFDDKPSEAVRNALKENKFRWNGKKKVWYGFANRADITKALRAAYDADKAYEIGVSEAKNSGSIVPAVKSEAMSALMEEKKNDLLPVIDAYNKGVADEINRQTLSEATAPVEPISAETIKNEEVNTNGTEETGAVLPHRRDGARAARLLDDAEAGAVQGDESAGDPVDDPGERGHETGRHDHRSDAERHERGHGEGSGESRDLRRDDDVTAEETAPAEEVTEEAPAADEAIPPKAETEEAKTELRKAVRMPVQGTNMEALLQGIKSKELSMESITLPGSVPGFNAIQREYLVKSLIDGVYTDTKTIKVAVPYDGKFEIENTPGNVAKVLDSLKVKVTQEVAVNKLLEKLMAGAMRVAYLTHNDNQYIANGHVLLSATDSDVEYAKTKYSAQEMNNPAVNGALDDAGDLITKAPMEAKNGKTTVYVFDINGKNVYFDKSLLSYLDGSLLYMVKFANSHAIKAVDVDGRTTGLVLCMKLRDEKAVKDHKPSKLKSFSKKMQAIIDAKAAKPAESVEEVTPAAKEEPKKSGAKKAKPASSEKLHEDVVEQIARQSTEQPKGRNFVIGDSLDLPNGEKARYKANVEAIRLVKKLEVEGRYATEAEQVILSKYVGWGGLANAFDQRKADWAKEYAELKELLTEEEYSSARGSTLNAHYTEVSVIKAMYDGLKQLGFTGGRMMEPSSGVGNFVGAMPADMSEKVRSWTMVELDGITGLIAKYLYPNADVRIQGFEKANIPDNFMDVAIGNVPFGNYAIADKHYPKKVTSAIHNYFFAKSLDKVRPGGIVMFITSSYTMNSSDSTVRRYIMQRADLLGAIRLPDTAFKGNAGTEVVTDILILKKRAANTNYAGEDFLEAPPTRPIAGNWNVAYINEYFNNHPEMVLGTASFEGGMYRGSNLTYKALEGRGSLADQIREAFQNIQAKMDYPAKLTPEKTNFAVERAGKQAKNNSLTVKDGKVYQNKDGELVEVKTAKGAAERIAGMLEIRDTAKALQTAQQQGQKESEVRKARTALNKAYDAFVKKYGFLNAQANRNAIKDDPDKFSIFALENYNPETKQATKADIFSKNTIAPNRTVTSAKDVAEGLIVSVNQTGGVDAALIAKLTGKTEEDVTRELLYSRKVFKNRNGGLETAEVYLSGNVRAKLRDAEAMVPMDKDYQRNVEALKAVVPEDVGYQDIFVNPGTPWIPDSVYSDFATHILGGYNTEWRKDVTVTRNADTGNFTVELGAKHLKYNAANTQKFGTSRRSFLDLFDAMLNSKSVVVKYKTDDGKSVVDQDATAAANEKVEAIQKEFQEWLWKDEGRRTELATLYNETFNSIVTPKYNGDNLTVNGANAMKPLRPHQRDAVQRIISSGGNTLLAHKVGAGKTYEMAAAAMKLKELGLVKKPLFAVPKSLVAQWGNEFMDFFPTAKLLVAEASDFTAANRKIFANRIANGEYDAVILSYEQFEKLPISADFARDLYQEQIDSIIRAIEEAKAEKGGKSLSVKDLEKKRKQLQTKIDKLTDTAKDEDNIEFEQLGVDSIFVDEAHNFKNLFYTTSMTNVSGLGNKDGSKRAFDLYTKVRYLQKLNGGRGIVFATATPVMNSMSEMYIMQKYLQPDLLDQLGLSTFDAWAKQFGEVVNGVEIKPSGQGYRVKQSFSRFKNMSELQLLFRNFADVLTDIPGLKIPKMKGGKVNVVVCDPGQFQQDYKKELEQRADNIKSVDPSVDNMLKITSDGRKISYTQRMIDPSLPYEEGCKIFRCADNVLRVYGESKAIKGTQIIFCDMATPKGKSKATAETEELETDMESAKLYDDIKARLMKGGIPAKEIAFIHEADTDAKKKKLFADVNEGKVRVLIGSTGKMGVGMNAQKRIVAIHHLDAPWRPGDVEQRNGRAYRQGNINDEVENFTYVTEGSFDARLWDILERKQNFINQVMNGENVGRETEDTGEVTLSAAEVKALASGSPLIMEQVQLDTDIKKLESLLRAHRGAVFNARQRLEADKGNIATLEKFVENGKKDLKARVDTYSEDKFSITIGRKKYTDKKDAGIALMSAATAKATEEGYTTIGSFAGFELRVIKTSEGIKGMISGSQGYGFNTYPGNISYMVNHLISKVEGIEEAVKQWEKKVTETRADMAEQEQLINQPFAKQAELDQKRARYNEVMAILNPKEEQQLSSMDEDTVQEQSREYLDEQHQKRTNTLTDREVLAMAADAIKVDDLTDAEKDALDIFKNRLSKLESLQNERAEQGRIYKEHQFGAKVDREAAKETLNRMKVLDDQIQAASAEVLSVEEKTVLKRVLQKARKVVAKEQWAHDQKTLERWRDRRNKADAIRKYRERLSKDVNALTDWVLHPNNKDVVKHIPDVLKDSVIPFLSSIDFTSKRQLHGGEATKADHEFMKRLNGLKAALKPDASVDGLYADYTDLPPNFMDRLQTLIDSAQQIVNQKTGDFVVNQMTSDELRELSQVVRTLKQYIQNFNRFHVNAMFQHVYEAGDSTIGELKHMGNASERTGKVSNFVFWQQIRPAYAFERFGKGGEAIYDGLRRGQAKLAFNTKTIEAFAKKAYTEHEVKAWEKHVKTINLGGDIVKMPVSAIMSFYELSKRPQALGHILGGGIRVATFKQGGKKISDTGHTITMSDVQAIIGTLTDRQKEVADKLQQFMQDQGGKWGNHVSVKRFGEELFGEEHYFPINSDGRHLPANADEHPSAASLYALLNMGFTKATQEGANNRVVLYSIFDVFANHMASMAQYNAFALPVVDAIKWFNYQQKSEADEDGKRIVLSSVRDQMDRVYGVPEESRPGSGRQGYAQTFVINILRAFNGTEAQGVPTDSAGIDMLHRYNVAQVAYNFRVVVQQPLAITRAALLIDYGSIIKGMKLNPAAIRKNIEEMNRYSGIAAWKSLGFYDVNISRGLTDLIKHDTGAIDKINDFGMKGAEIADTLTWAGIWSACKEEVIKKQRIKPKDAGFYEAVTKLFEDVIYKTQVVDSVLTKNEYLRSKGFFARTIGSFMSEPTTTASMLINAYDKYHADMQRGMNRTQAWKKNSRMIGRTMYVYGLSAVILAAVQAVADAWRDDDDYKEFLEKWLEAFSGNLLDEIMPLNKLPIFSEFYEFIKELISVGGFDIYGQISNLTYAEIGEKLVSGLEILYGRITGEEDRYTWYGGIYKLLQAVSGMTGLPMAAATREVITAWNNTAGAMAPSLKVKTYDSGEKNEIKYAYEDGYLTAEEAMAELMDKALVDTEDEAYWTVQGWEAGEGYSRYDAIYDAVRSGSGFNQAMKELTTHGYDEDDVLRQVKDQIGEWYRDGEITKQQAITMLTKYSGMDSEDITPTVNKWSSKVVTGIAFDDIKEEFLDGNITAQRAVEMYVRYGGYDQDKASETVTKWRAEKETGIVYDDIKDAFMDGEITEGDVRNMYVTYGGYSQEEATEKAAIMAFVKQHPGCDGISWAAVESYTEYCESSGMKAETFWDAWKYNSTTKADVDANGESISGSKKVKVLSYINGLDLTYAQKDTLYYAFGWAESRIYEAPWH